MSRSVLNVSTSGNSTPLEVFIFGAADVSETNFSADDLISTATQNMIISDIPVYISRIDGDGSLPAPMFSLSDGGDSGGGIGQNIEIT